MIEDSRPRCVHLVVYPEENCIQCLHERVVQLETALEQAKAVIDNLKAVQDEIARLANDHGWARYV